MSGKECLTKSLFVISRNVTVMNGETETHEDTKVLQIIEQTVKFLPSDIEKFFPRLEELWVLYSKLGAIEKSDLKPFPRLRELVLRGNNIEILSDDLFRSNSELVFVDIGDNKLKIIGEKLLLRMMDLKKIDLRQNSCIDKLAWTHDEMQQLYDTGKSNCSLVVEKNETFDDKSYVKFVHNEISREVEETSYKTEALP